MQRCMLLTASNRWLKLPGKILIMVHHALNIAYPDKNKLLASLEGYFDKVPESLSTTM